MNTPLKSDTTGKFKLSPKEEWRSYGKYRARICGFLFSLLCLAGIIWWLGVPLTKSIGPVAEGKKPFAYLLCFFVTFAVIAVLWKIFGMTGFVKEQLKAYRQNNQPKGNS